MFMNKGEGQNKEAIDEDLLILSGAVYKNYDKDEYIFQEGQHPHFYYQVIEGKVKMVNETEEGKNFIQGFFGAGESFGEPPLFTGEPYPAAAIAEQPSIVIRLSIPSFVQMLKDNFDVHWNLTKTLAKRLRRKAISLKDISCYTPEQRILSLLSNFKKETLPNNGVNNKVRIDYTRQQIADMTGLRVETVIRVMRNLFDKNLLTIEKGKVFY